MGVESHAITELKLAGFYGKDADYGGALATAVQELCSVFAKQGHSGMSAELTIQLFQMLARQQAITPITENPDEWHDISDVSDGMKMWQNIRDCRFFSKDGGKTWYNVDEPKDK